MKEERFFYVPGACDTVSLPPDEATHALRVLRLGEGDELMLMDGNGIFYRAIITVADNHHCYYKIIDTLRQQPAWQGHFHLAIAPTKMMERMEWLAEKATEIGFDELSLLDCRFSERRIVKTERLSKIVISAVKQSRKAWVPQLNEMCSFPEFLARHTTGRRYIAHCYREVPRHDLFTLLSQHPGDDATVLVGPEGDFSVDEVHQALDAGYIPVSLGNSRLRTETAGLAAVMMMQLTASAQPHTILP